MIKYDEALASCQENCLPYKQVTPMDITWMVSTKWAELMNKRHNCMTFSRIRTQLAENEMNSDRRSKLPESNEMEQFEPGQDYTYFEPTRKRQRR